MKLDRKAKKIYSNALYLLLGITVGFVLGQIYNGQGSLSAYSHESHGEELAHAGLLPQSMHVIHRQNYSLGYDGRTKNAAWVHERLTADCLNGSASRDHCPFVEDEGLPKTIRATLNDYKGSGFDRGHLAPAANHKTSTDEMQETFYLSNMCPQCPQLNRGYWAKLEKHVRELTKSFDVVNVITGPLYLSKQRPDGKRFVEYQVLGINEVAVPTHFFKVLLLEKGFSPLEFRAYVLPNEPIDSRKPLDSFQTTVDKIEKLSGIIFQKHKT